MVLQEFTLLTLIQNKFSNMKTDIKGRSDIEFLINEFYKKVKNDDKIGHFFSHVVIVNWNKHLPIMYDFWENILFHTGGYNGNPMEKHLNLNMKSPLRREHFERWTRLFDETVDEHFSGGKAILIKQRALSIATVIQLKIFNS